MQDVILHGDCLELLKTLESNSVDSLVCDPPAGIAFMGKDWDNFSDKKPRNGQAERDAYRAVDLSRPGYANSHGTTPTAKERTAFIDFMTAVMAECLRVVKPGGHALVWALPRTSHWTATALEDAGWEIRDVITHTFGSGFPKSHDISKAIDKQAGAEREVVSTHRTKDIRRNVQRDQEIGWNTRQGKLGTGAPTTYMEHAITAPATPDAQRWSGYGSALKPASEHWILARKPLAAANLASNVLAWGTGGLNIAATRVGTSSTPRKDPHNGNLVKAHMEMRPWMERRIEEGLPLKGDFAGDQGRWPPNFLLSHSADCTPLVCSESCSVAALDEQAGERKSGAGDKGNKHTRGIWGNAGTFSHEYEIDIGANVSRFFPVFYAAKASRRERNAGCEALPVQAQHRNGAGLGEGHHPEAPTIEGTHHPTVKSLALMSWLVRLITPPSGTVLDCFAGSGSTLVACVQEGFHFIGMEQDASYIEIAKARIAHAQREQKPAKPRAKITRLPKRPKAVEQLAMFA